MGMAAPIYYTADMVRSLPEDGNRYEVVHGELLVTPAPRLSHQHAVLELATRLHTYLRIHPVGRVLIAIGVLAGLLMLPIAHDLAHLAPITGRRWTDAAARTTADSSAHASM